MTDKGSEAALSNAREETPKIFLLLAGELCRIENDVAAHTEAPLEATAVCAGQTVCLCELQVCRKSRYRRADASQNESQQMIPRWGAADYDQGSSWSLG